MNDYAVNLRLARTPLARISGRSRQRMRDILIIGAPTPVGVCARLVLGSGNGANEHVGEAETSRAEAQGSRLRRTWRGERTASMDKWLNSEHGDG